jgi:hypothetical protein
MRDQQNVIWRNGYYSEPYLSLCFHGWSLMWNFVIRECSTENVEGFSNVEVVVFRVVDHAATPLSVRSPDMVDEVIKTFNSMYQCISIRLMLSFERVSQMNVSCSTARKINASDFSAYPYVIRGGIGKFSDCYFCNCLGERRWEGGQSQSLLHQSAT